MKKVKKAIHKVKKKAKKAIQKVKKPATKAAKKAKKATKKAIKKSRTSTKGPHSKERKDGGMGCFRDCKGGRDLPVRKGNGSKQQCAARCKGYKYFGHQWTQECWCGNRYGSQGKIGGCKPNAHNIGGCRNYVYQI